jgi:cell division protease FtsH
MSEEVGNVSFYDSSGQSEYGFTKPYSEKTAELIDHEAKKIVEVSYSKAKEVISANIDGLTRLAEQLLEKEVIFSEDLEQIFGKRKGDISRSMTEETAKVAEPAKAEESAKADEHPKAEEPLKSE